MYLVGWNKQEIMIQPQGFAMFGYGSWTHRAYEKRTALFARTFSIRESSSISPILICCLDFGCITHAMRQGVTDVLKIKFSELFEEQKLVLMATHTHSAPGGCAYEALYNIPTPGFVPEHLSAVVDAVVKSVEFALKTERNTEIRYCTEAFDSEIPVAWNRALKSYNRNPDVVQRSEKETHLALNREMQLIGFYRNEQLCSFISLFGVHATCLGNTLKAHDGDNKGYASQFSEQCLKPFDNIQPVAIFAQAAAGDVSPHFHGKHQDLIRRKIQGEAEYQYAQRNGRFQSDLAFKALQQTTKTVEGNLDGILSYVDLSDVKIPQTFCDGVAHAQTSMPCHGVAFYAGTPVDGHGAAKPIIMAMSLLSKRTRKKRLAQPNAVDYAKYKTLYESQYPKDIVTESPDNLILGKPLNSVPSVLDPIIKEINRQVAVGAIQQTPLVPSVVPLQILKIGQLIISCCPGEITTVSAQRVMQTIQQELSQSMNVDKVWLASYCNDYMGYITTREEYQQQAYEGGHTLFGQWTLAATQYKFQTLAEQLQQPSKERLVDTTTRPLEIPRCELEKRTNHGNLKTAVR